MASEVAAALGPARPSPVPPVLAMSRAPQYRESTGRPPEAAATRRSLVATMEAGPVAVRARIEAPTAGDEWRGVGSGTRRRNAPNPAPALHHQLKKTKWVAAAPREGTASVVLADPSRGSQLPRTPQSSPSALWCLNRGSGKACFDLHHSAGLDLANVSSHKS